MTKVNTQETARK